MKLLLVLAVVLLLRAPFLNQAIQGDDIDYLAGAQHAQIDPAHPTHVRYVFLGSLVDMQGHPHPPLNVWFLGLLLAVVGDIREVPFHAAYIVFSVIAAASMWSLARRFSPHPLWATLLFLATPAFVVNGTSFESDLPFLAFWMAGVALTVEACNVSAQGGAGFSLRWPAAAGTLALASLAAFQAILLTPILLVYVWLFARRSRAAWAVAMVPPLVIAAWQLYEYFSTGTLPASVLTGYLQSYGFEAVAHKINNAAALSVHACWLVFPLLLPPAFLLSRKRRDPDTLFLASWIVIFFAGALAIFFAGSARYLLPIAAPVALLVSRLSPGWLAAGFTAQMALSLSLAVVNYQHWDGYRSFAASLKPQVEGKRLWINTQWGLRYYLEADGGIPLLNEQAIRPGDVVVSTDLSYRAHFTTRGGALAPIAQREIRASLPLRLFALQTRSAYSTIDRGYLPFDISTAPIDRVRAEMVVERKPALEYLPMNAPEAEQQLVSGVYALEDNRTRWTAGQAAILLKSPAAPRPVQVVFYIPATAPARRITLLLDGKPIVEKTVDQPGLHTIESPTQHPLDPSATLTIVVDKTFSVPGDGRVLGIVLSEAGFK